MNAQELMAKARRAIAKTRSGVIAAFSLQFVKTGLLPLELGRAFNKIEDLRLVADYKGDLIDESEARWAVEQALAFVEEIDRRFVGKTGT